MKRLPATVFLFVVCSISVFSSAQSTQPENCSARRQSIKVNHIRGVVADVNRGVISRVKVTLQKAKGDGLEGIVSLETSDLGKFDFSTVTAGKYHLVFQRSGFYFADVPVEVLETGWDAFWLTMTVAAMDSRELCGDKYKVEALSKASFATDKLAK